MMKQIGIKMDIRNVPSAGFSKVINGKQYDMFSRNHDQPDPYGMEHLCDVYCRTGSNLSGTGSAELDAKLGAVAGATTADQQTALGNAVELEAVRDHGTIVTSSLPLIYAVRTGLANVGAEPWKQLGEPEAVGWQK